MLKNGLYNIFGTAIRMGFSLLTIPLLIRIVGIEEYGLWTLVSSVVAIVALAEGGLSVSTTFFLSKAIAEKSTRDISQVLCVTVTAMFALSTFAAIILWFGSSTLIHFFPDLNNSESSTAIKALQIGGIVLWGRLPQQVFVGVEQAYERYGLMNLLSTIQVAITSLGMITVVFLGGKTIEMMLLQAFVSIVMLTVHILTNFYLLRKEKLQFLWSRSKGFEIVRYSFATWFTSIGSALFQQGDKLIVGGVLGTQILGVYAAITSVATQINTFSAVAVQPLLPQLNIMLKSSRQNLEKKIKQMFQINTFLALGLGLVLFVSTPVITNFLFKASTNNDFRLSFQIAILIYSIYSVNAVGYYTLLGIGDANTSMIISLISGIISLSLIFVGAKYWGLIGAVSGNIGYWGIFFCTIIALKRLNISISRFLCSIHVVEF